MSFKTILKELETMPVEQKTGESPHQKASIAKTIKKAVDTADPELSTDTASVLIGRYEDGGNVFSVWAIDTKHDGFGYIAKSMTYQDDLNPVGSRYHVVAEFSHTWDGNGVDAGWPDRAQFMSWIGTTSSLNVAKAQYHNYAEFLGKTLAPVMEAYEGVLQDNPHDLLKSGADKIVKAYLISVSEREVSRAASNLRSLVHTQTETLKKSVIEMPAEPVKKSMSEPQVEPLEKAEVKTTEMPTNGAPLMLNLNIDRNNEKGAQRGTTKTIMLNRSEKGELLSATIVEQGND